MTIVATFGLIITAGYFLYMLQRVLLGPLNLNCAKYSDMNGREIFTLVPLVVITVVVGIFPNTVLKFQAAAIQALVSSF